MFYYRPKHTRFTKFHCLGSDHFYRNIVVLNYSNDISCSSVEIDLNPDSVIVAYDVCYHKF